MTVPSAPRARGSGRLAPWLIFAALAAAIAGWRITRTLPPLPATMSLTVVFPAGPAGDSQPLITTGATGAGDFLYVRYVDATRLVFGYDSWANGGPESAPVTIVPGRPHRLDLELTTLARLGLPPKSARGRLHLSFDGRELLNHEVHYRGRTRTEVWFGENPIGGTKTGQAFGGTLATSDGVPLRGVPYRLVPWSSRLRTWLTQEPAEGLLILALAALAVFGLPPAWHRGIAYLAKPHAALAEVGRPRPPHAWFLATALVCTFAFVTVITGGTYRLIFPESFGSFYDHQAASLLAGHLDVPEEAVSSESFVFHGKHYGYFGPTPALLRVPFVLTGVAFGQLSRAFMTCYFVGCLAATYALLILATRHLAQRPAWPSAGGTVLLVGSAGLGSTLFFTASRAYIYHEAILCGAMFALGSAWFSLRYLADATRRRWWLGALGCGLLALHARPPAGLFALGFLGFVAATHLAHAWAAPLRVRLRPILVGAFAVVAVLSFNLLSYLKFESFEGAPLRYNVQYEPNRLAAIAGGNFHLVNFRFNFDHYFWRPSFVLRPKFPWFFISGAGANYNRTRIDMAEDTLAVAWAMPALTLLAAAAVAGSLLAAPGARLPVVLLVLGSLPMALALCTAIAISHRYTGDFVPPLLTLAAFGVALLPAFPPYLRRSLGALAVICAVLAAPVTLAITLRYQGEGVWGVSDDILAHYQSLQRRCDALFGSRAPQPPATPTPAAP